MISNPNDPNLNVVADPEIFIGLVGPIGVDLNSVQEQIQSQLKRLGYRPELIKITDLMQQFMIDDAEISDTSYIEKYLSLIDYADKFRKKCEKHPALAALSIDEIRTRRAKYHASLKKEDWDPEKHEHFQSEPVPKTAYIIRQFKLPQEIELMRATYGRKFIQISVHSSLEERKENLINSIKNFNSDRLTKAIAEQQAIQLIEKDLNEENEKFGQRMTDVFHLGDVFVLGNNKKFAENTIRRFFDALFGSNAISPSKMEYGMYAAAGASLRSIDLSRQVGAAIFSGNGEVITMGCNEVPKAFGGTYWDDDTDETFRDFEEGSDANQNRKVEILHDFITRLDKLGLMKSTSSGEENTVSQKVSKLIGEKLIRDSQLMDIIEFGRMVHAEMNAITDSARLGRSIQNSTLFCTTFPCHMCAKHIVSSGVKRVVFLEPYPKSYAEDLHKDSITFSKADSEIKVLFEPFVGISPRRYRDIFEKKKRKNNLGIPLPWYAGDSNSGPAPRIEDTSQSYIENEEPAIAAGGLLRAINQS